MSEKLKYSDYTSYFCAYIADYFKNGGIKMKDGNVVEVAHVYSLDDYLFVYLPEKIKKSTGDVQYYLDAMVYGNQIKNEATFAEIIEAFKKGIEAANEKYLIAKDGTSYLKEMKGGLGKDGNVIVIEYKNDDK
jgi:hypothetical protein